MWDRGLLLECQEGCLVIREVCLVDNRFWGGGPVQHFSLIKQTSEQTLCVLLATAIQCSGIGFVHRPSTLGWQNPTNSKSLADVGFESPKKKKNLSSRSNETPLLDSGEWLRAVPLDQAADSSVYVQYGVPSRYLGTYARPRR